MAAVFDSAIDKACFASPEAAAADAAVALLAAAAVPVYFARSACSLSICCCRPSIRASMGLRSVQPAVRTRIKMAAFALVFTLFSLSNITQGRVGNRRILLRTAHPTHSSRL